jgi:Fe-S cluster assembly protein SufD
VDWLATMRAQALAIADELGVPTSQIEEWRYSHIDDLDLSAIAPESREGRTETAPIPEAEDDSWIATAALWGSRISAIVQHTGVDGLLVGPAPSSMRFTGGAAAFPGAVDYFDAMNLAHTLEPLVVDVAAGAQLGGPVLVSITAPPRVVSMPRIFVRCGERSVASVMVWITGGEAAAVVPRISLDIGASARCELAVVNDVARDAVMIGGVTAEVAGFANLQLGYAGVGGKYARARFDTNLNGGGAEADLYSVYLGSGDQRHDLRTFQRHLGRDTTSKLEFHGAGADRSHLVYTGLIQVAPDARGTDASQTNRNLKLSEDAWAESVPNLEILNNDVRCSHASSIGTIDEDQRFYLESRGVPEAEAERLLLSGFFQQVIGESPLAGWGHALGELLDPQRAGSVVTAATPVAGGGALS